MRALVVEDEATPARGSARTTGEAGLHRRRRGRWRRRIVCRLRIPARHRGDRPWAAEAPRPRTDPQTARRGQEISHPRSSPRATAGRTRSKACRPARTITSPSPITSKKCWRACRRCCAAPAAGRQPDPRVRPHPARHARPGRDAQWRAHRAHHVRIPHSRAHDAARRRCDLQDRAHRAALRPGLRARQQRHRSVHRAIAPQARSRRDARPIETLRGRGYRFAIARTQGLPSRVARDKVSALYRARGPGRSACRGLR